MNPFEDISQLHNQNPNPDLPLQSEPSIDTDNLVQLLAQDFQNLVLSFKDDASDRDLHGYSLLTADEDQLKQAIHDELRDLVLKEAANEAFQAESSNGENLRDGTQFVDEVVERRDLEKVPEVDPVECRVLDGGEIGESIIRRGNQEEGVDAGDDAEAFKHDADTLNEKHEIQIVDGSDGDEIGGYENNSEQGWGEDGNDRDYQHIQDLENERENGGGSMTVPDDGRLKSYHYPLRPDAEDCSYYMRTGMCKFGSGCKFNHPLKRKHQHTRETQKQKEENTEMHGQIECKYFLSSAGCKYGKACKFGHGRVKTVITPVVEYNFLGLPIRPGEKECPYYMRNGSCKYGPNCRFNHPDPSAAAGSDAGSPATYGNDVPLPLQPPPQPKMPNLPSWSGSRTPDPTPAAFVPVMYPPAQNMPPPNPDWNGYHQAPAAVPVHVYPSSERGLPIPPAFFLNNPPTDANMYTHQHQHQPQHHQQHQHHHQQHQHQHQQHQHQQQQPMVVSEYPERPGQPECSYFMKTGDCKYRSSCKFHHPKSRITRTTQSVLSDKGLPLRPDQSICTYYSRYGICKYGPACKYDHPVNYNSSSRSNSTHGSGEGYDGSDWGGPLVQQSV